MIDFRYHLVSLVAVFLALAVGIVLGSSVLNGPLTRTLQHAEANLRSTADNLRAQNNQQASRLSGDANFVTANAPRLLAGNVVYGTIGTILVGLTWLDFVFIVILFGAAWVVERRTLEAARG